MLRVHELDAVVLPPTELPHIMKLSLRIEDTLEHVVDPFLRALRLPNLRAFTFELAFSAEEHDDEEEDEDDQYIIDPWTRESCAVNLFLSALFVPEEHFRHLTDLSLDIQVEPAFIKDNFRIPFHRLPMLERLHVRTNRNVFAPKPHQVYTIPSDGLHLKELRTDELRVYEEFDVDTYAERVRGSEMFGAGCRGGGAWDLTRDDGIVGALLSEREDTSAAEQ